MSDQGSHPPDPSARPWPSTAEPVSHVPGSPRGGSRGEEQHSQHCSSHASESCSAEQSPSPVPTRPQAATPRRTPAPQPGEDEHTPVCRVVIADDNPAERAGLAGILDAPGDIAIVAEVADAAQACDAAALHAPDVVLLDVRTPSGDSVATLTDLVALAPVLLLTYDRDSEIVQQALRLGALGYLVHGAFSDDELLAAVRAVRDTPGSSTVDGYAPQMRGGGS